FQAEDGIRDFHVTGVQTCALPILGIRNFKNQNSFSQFIFSKEMMAANCPYTFTKCLALIFRSAFWSSLKSSNSLKRSSAFPSIEIGRASCREIVKNKR